MTNKESNKPIDVSPLGAKIQLGSSNSLVVDLDDLEQIEHGIRFLQAMLDRAKESK